MAVLEREREGGGDPWSLKGKVIYTTEALNSFSVLIECGVVNSQI